MPASSPDGCLCSSCATLAPLERLENSGASDWRHFERELRRKGWRIEPAGSGHWKLYSPGGTCLVTTSSTPSDHRAFKNIEAQVRRCEREERKDNPAVDPARAEACRKQGQGSKWLRPGRRHALYLRDGYRCAYCDYVDPDKLGRGLTIDHLVACERGGTNADENLVCCCLSCNSSKQHLSRRAWYAYLVARKGYDRSHVDLIQAELRRRIARRLDRPEGLRLSRRAHQHRADRA